MEKIFSKIEPECLCHIVHRGAKMKKGRVDLIDPDEHLQLATLKHDKGKTFKPHYHIRTQKVITITQESWVVLKGRVRATFYDLDKTILCHKILKAGDCSLTMIGGHTYTFLEDDSRVLEFKAGKYQGQERDKEFI